MCKEKEVKNMECKCKQICCKMQNQGLRCAINTLRVHRDNSNTILRTLEAIYNSLSVYSCLPGTCLLERVKWVYDNIEGGNAPLYTSEGTKLNMLIKELEVFVDNC